MRVSTGVVPFLFQHSSTTTKPDDTTRQHPQITNARPQQASQIRDGDHTKDTQWVWFHVALSMI
jgi:hypothetical protein